MIYSQQTKSKLSFDSIAAFIMIAIGTASSVYALTIIVDIGNVIK